MMCDETLCVLPFNPALESSEDFEDRLCRLLPSEERFSRAWESEASRNSRQTSRVSARGSSRLSSVGAFRPGAWRKKPKPPSGKLGGKSAADQAREA